MPSPRLLNQGISLLGLCNCPKHSTLFTIDGRITDSIFLRSLNVAGYPGRDSAVNPAFRTGGELYRELTFFLSYLDHAENRGPPVLDRPMSQESYISPKHS